MAKELDTDYHSLNAMVNLYDNEGNLQLGMDKEATRQYFLQHVNKHMQWFHSLEEKIDYLVDNGYWSEEVISQYDKAELKSLFKYAYSFKFRFSSFLGAYKFYSSYAMKSNDGDVYLERFEDRVVMVAVSLAEGDLSMAEKYIEEIIQGRYQPATPTFSNAGKRRSGEQVSCFLLETTDDLESIMRTLTNAAQLSKIGGGVGINITNIRGKGDPIKEYKNQSSGVVPFMKQLDDLSRYIDQLGNRAGAFAVYMNALHFDILDALDTKRENADDSVRIKSLSIGVVIPDIVFELARSNEDMYLFSPYDVEREYGMLFSDVDKTAEYRNMVDNPNIRKKKTNARKFFQYLSEIQFESGYPYIMFEDTVNRANPVNGKISYSNLCVTGDSKILTNSGYRIVSDLYESQEDFDVIVDTRARDMDYSNVGVSTEKSTKMMLTAENAEVYLLTTNEGFTLRATAWHKMYVEREGEVYKLPLSELVTGDKILVQPNEGSFGSVNATDLGYLAGVIAADGTIINQSEPDELHSPTARVYLYDSKHEVAGQVLKSVHSVLADPSLPVRRQATRNPEFTGIPGEMIQLNSAPLGEALIRSGVSKSNKTDVPDFVLNGDRATQISYLSGLFQMEACVAGHSANATSIEVGSTNHGALQDIQRILLNLGVYSRIYAGRKTSESTLLPDGRGGLKEYLTKPTWSLRITSKKDVSALVESVRLRPSQQVKVAERLGSAVKNHYNTHKYRATVLSVDFDGVEDVYDVTVANGHSVIFNGISTGNCSEILQVRTPSEFNEAGEYATVGRDISCNLGSLDVARVVKSTSFSRSIGTAIRALTAVSDQSNIASVPTVQKANADYHSVGLGHMNLHGFLMEHGVDYGSEDALNFVEHYFRAVAYYGLRESNKIALERGEVFYDFENSDYADGTYFDRIFSETPEPNEFTLSVIGDIIPTDDEWEALAASITEFGLYHSYLFATAPTGSISYVKHSTSSIHPVPSKLEIRKEGKVGRVYYPQYGLTPENFDDYKDAYEIGYEKIIDTYATAQRYVDQGMSLTLFFKDTATTRDLDRARNYAWKKGIKTIYYIRLRQNAIEGTEVEGCVSCTV